MEQPIILYCYLFLFYLLVKQFKIQLQTYALVLVVSALIVSFVAIKDWILLNIFHQPILNYAGRVVSTFGQPNFYAGFLLFTLPFSYLLFKGEDKKLAVLGWFGAVISILGIFVSYSRSSIFLSLVLVILGLLGELNIKFKKGFLLGFVLILAAFLVISVKLAVGFLGKEISQPLSQLNPDLTKEPIEKRIYIWPQAIKAAWQKPLTGYGLENTDKAFSAYFAKSKHSLFEENLNISPVLISFKDLILDRTHNYLLDLLIFSGAGGVFSFLILVVLVFRTLLKTPPGLEKNILWVSLVVYLTWIQFQNQSVVHLMYFWFLMGVTNSKICDHHRVVPKLNQKGVIAQILILLILIAGIVGGIYLVQHPQIFKPKAGGGLSGPIALTANFIFSGQSENIKVGDVVGVSVLVRSDISASNLFKAKITFPTDIFAVDHIDYGASFIKAWVEQHIDNAAGTISLVGGVPHPGFITNSTDAPALVAVIFFKALKPGRATITYGDDSAIYSDDNNINILSSKETITLSVNSLSENQSLTSTPAAPSVNYAGISPIPTPAPVVGSGDGNGDGKIDLADMSVFFTYYNNIKGYKAEVDLNGDGKINVLDFEAMLQLLIQKGIIPQ